MSRSQAHICHCLRRIKNLRRDSPLAIDGDRRKSGEEFADDVICLARGLSALGVRCGDVIAIAALNSDFYMEWLLAITFVGGIAAPLNYRWSFDEARSAIEVVRPVMLVVDDRCSSWALALQNENCVPSVRLYAFIGGHSFQNLGSSGSVLSMDAIKMSALGPAVPELMWAPKGIALICFTSGTTGQPKGVAISHMALTVQSLAKIAIVGYGESDVYLHTAPLCHIGGISSCIAMLLVAACHVFMPKFDAKLSFLAIKQHQVTSLITVPAMLADLISFARNSNDLNGGETVNKILNGGGGLSSALINLAALTFPHTKIISAYGMTETCSSLTFMTIYDPVLQKSAKSLSRNHKVNDKHVGVLVGKPAPHIELRISGDFDSLDSPSVGSILTRGSHVMVGYYGQRMEIMVDSKDGWLDTGDIGWIDGNGDLWLVGRKKDRIKSGGENIYPEEVEAVLARHPGVFKAVVVGVPNARLSEMVVACISIRDDWKWTDQKISHSQGVQELSSEILQSFCGQHKLTRFKVPKIFIPWKQQFPQTTTGKLRREDVRKEVVTQMKLISSSL